MNTRLLLEFFLLICYTFALTTSPQLVSWSGGHCNVCGTNNNNYACSNNHGQWLNGKKAFLNIVPNGHTVTGIEIKMYGVWGCNGNTAQVNISLNGELIQQKTLTGQCGCNTCDSVETFLISGLTHMNNYNYNGTNQLHVQVLSGSICVNRAQIVLTYKVGNPPGVYTPPVCPSGCGTHGKCVYDENGLNPHCKCNLYWSGPQCQCYVPSEHLKTDNPPKLDYEKSGFNTRDQLHLHFNVSSKFYDNSVKFRGQLDDRCEYKEAVTSVFWSRKFDEPSCQYLLHARIPWTTAYPACIFKRTVKPNYLEFDGESILKNYEHVGNQTNYRNPRDDIIRTTISRLPFAVRFPRRITMTQIGTCIFDENTLFASITHLEFDTEHIPLPGQGTVVLNTNANKNFYLQFLSSTGPLGLSRSVTGPTGEGPMCVDQNEACLQDFVMKLQPDKIKCNLNGVYSMLFKLHCRPHVNPCPLDGNETETVSFTLQSANFCSKIIDDIDLSGSIETYGNTQMRDPEDRKVSFVEGQRVYFKVSASSNKATIVNTRVSNIRVVRWDNSQVTLLSGSLPTGLGTNVNIQTNDNWGSPRDSQFSFQLLTNMFNVPNDGKKKINVKCTLEVTYQNTKKRILKFNRMLDKSGQTFDVEESFIIETTESNDTLSSKMIGLLTMVILSLALVIV